MATEQSNTLTLTLLRADRHVRGGDTYFVLHGFDPKKEDGQRHVVTLRIGSSNCPVEVADVLCMARDGDTISLSYNVVQDMGMPHYLYSKAALMGNFPGPRGVLVTGGLTSQGNHALLPD